MASPEVAAERLPPVTAAELSLSVVTAPLPPPVVAWLDWTFDSVDCDLPAFDVALPVLDVARPVVASEGLVVVLAPLPPAGAALPAPLFVVTGVGHGLLPVAFEEFVGTPVPPLGEGEDVGSGLTCGSDGLEPAAAVMLAGPATDAGCAVLLEELGGLDAVDAAGPAGGIAALGCSVVGWLAVALAPVPDVADGPSSVFDTGCGALAGVLEGELLPAAAGTALEVFEPLAVGDS